MPMVGTGSIAVISRASGSTTASTTIAKAPASATASPSALIDSAAWGSRPCTLKPPIVLKACGVSPMWPITGIPRSTRKWMVSAMRRPPSTFTAPQPVSFITRAADRNACSGLSS